MALRSPRLLKARVVTTAHWTTPATTSLRAWVLKRFYLRRHPSWQYRLWRAPNGRWVMARPFATVRRTRHGA